MECPDCHSAHIRKNGKRRGKQNHICVECNRQFLDRYDPPSGYSDDVKRECLKMSVNGMGFRAVPSALAERVNESTGCITRPSSTGSSKSEKGCRIVMLQTRYPTWENSMNSKRLSGRKKQDLDLDGSLLGLTLLKCFHLLTIHE